jgi:hypothetical protein
MFISVPLVVGFLSLLVESRQWNDTGVGTIIFEEAVSFPDIVPVVVLPYVLFSFITHFLDTDFVGLTIRSVSLFFASIEAIN